MKAGCYLSSDNLEIPLENIEGRVLGVCLSSGSFNPNQILGLFKDGAPKGFFGLSAAYSLHGKDDARFRVQSATISSAIGLHLSICNALGVSVPYRFGTEPGEWAELRNGSTEAESQLRGLIADARKLLPSDMPIRICQNDLRDDAKWGALSRAVAIALESGPVRVGVQVWLSPWGGCSPGMVMGRLKSAAAMGAPGGVSEFGLLLRSKPPHPAMGAMESLFTGWRHSAWVNWALSTGLSAEETPYWLPLNEFDHGPYCTLPWSSIESFDEGAGAVYAEIALRGGPFGVGADFRETEEVPVS